MDLIRYRRLILWGLIVGLLIGSMLVFQGGQNNNITKSATGNTPLSASQSTDPGNPHILYDDSSVHEYYNASTSYYYRTENASSSRYQVVWLQPDNAPSNFDLYLYNDSGYSNLMISSNRGTGLLDWVIFRPNSSQYLYAKVRTISGLGGFAFVEWEDSSYNLSIDNSVSSSLSSPDSLEVYQIFLSNTSAYRFRLDVPNEGDFDLYLYQLNPGEGASYTGYAARSKTLGTGALEIISNYTPAESGNHAVIVVRSSGSGSYVLAASGFPSTPESLLNDSSLNETYNASASYYYQTGNASSSYYHVVWLQPQNALDNFDLYLYSDNQYSNYQVSSLRGNGLLDWVIFRPSTSQSFYSEAYAHTGSDANATIEWEDSSKSLTAGNPVSGSLNSSNCIDIYQAYLTSSLKYWFSLDVPAGSDYDLYLYYLSSGTETNHLGYSSSSTSPVNGTDETITKYEPTATGYYALVIVRSNGNGSYALNMSSIQELNDDSPEYVQYEASVPYYYQTGWASSSNYHVIWVQPVDALDNFDLFLYSDTNYSNFIVSSERGNGVLDWVVFRPSTSQTLYPQAVPLGGSSGYAYIEWEDSSDWLSYTDASGFLNSSDFIEVYEISLYSSLSTSFTLEVPFSGDFDLYLYYLDPGDAADTSGSLSSAAAGLGVDEIITFSPNQSGSYVLLVVRANGFGAFTLSYDYSFTPTIPINPYYFYLLIGAGIAGLIIIPIVLIKKKKRRKELQERRF